MSALDLFPEVRVDPTVDVNRRYTTREFDLWCRAKAGVGYWDLDVAADEESHLAAMFYVRPGDDCTSADGIDGLRLCWGFKNGNTNPWAVWCNPPFDDLEAWVRKADFEWREALEDHLPLIIAMVMPANRVEQPFWQKYIEPNRDGRSSWPPMLTTHYPPGRVKYGHPGNRDARGVGSADFPSVLLVWRSW